MRRMFLAVSGLALGVALVTGVGVRAEQAQDAAVIDKAMKSLGPAFGATRKALDSGNMADAKTGAQTVPTHWVPIAQPEAQVLSGHTEAAGRGVGDAGRGEETEGDEPGVHFAPPAVTARRWATV